MPLSEGVRIECVNTFLRVSSIESATERWPAKRRSNSAPPRVKLTTETEQESAQSLALLWQIESLNELCQCKNQAAVQAMLFSASPAVLPCCKDERLASQKAELPHGFSSECGDALYSHEACIFHEDGRSAVEPISKRLDTIQASNSQGLDPCQNSFTLKYAALPRRTSVSDTTSKLWRSLCEGQHLDMKQDKVGITTAML